MNLAQNEKLTETDKAWTTKSKLDFQVQYRWFPSWHQLHVHVLFNPTRES